MADVIHRTTLELRQGQNTPDYLIPGAMGDPGAVQLAGKKGDPKGAWFVPHPEWLINPDLSAVRDVPQHYWKLDGDKVFPMDKDEQAKVDAAIERAAREAEIAYAKYELASDKCLAVLWAGMNATREELGLKPMALDEVVK